MEKNKRDLDKRNRDNKKMSSKKNYKAKKAYADSSRDNNRFKDLSDDYIYGVNSVKEAILSGRTINALYLAKGRRSKNVHEIIVMAKEQKILIKEVDIHKLKHLVGTDRHQGIVAYVSPYQYYDIDDILNDNSEFVVALDGITDVHNFGAILRTVEAAGFKYVIIPERKSVAINSALSRTSAGAIEYLRVVRVKSLSNALRTLREHNYFVIGSDMGADTDYRDMDYSGKHVLIIGSEGDGMRKHIAKLCDYNVSIPMIGKINSLNASVSASIIVYEKMRSMVK